MAIFGIYKDNYDKETAFANKTIGFDPKQFNLVFTRTYNCVQKHNPLLYN